MHTFSCCLRLRGIGELRKNVVVKISQTELTEMKKKEKNSKENTNKAKKVPKSYNTKFGKL